MKIKHTLTAGIFAIGVAAMFASTAHALPPQYIVYDLGALGPDGAFSYGAGLNEAGQIAGYSYLSSNNKEGPHAFLYANSSMHDLGTLGGATSSGKVVNNVGQIAGTSGTTSGHNAFLYANGTMNSLGTLGGNSSFGEGLNLGRMFLLLSLNCQFIVIINSFSRLAILLK